jgi:hypothetical protein
MKHEPGDFFLILFLWMDSWKELGGHLGRTRATPISAFKVAAYSWNGWGGRLRADPELGNSR